LGEQCRGARFLAHEIGARSGLSRSGRRQEIAAPVPLANEDRAQQQCEQSDAAPVLLAGVQADFSDWMTIQRGIRPKVLQDGNMKAWRGKKSERCQMFEGGGIALTDAEVTTLPAQCCHQAPPIQKSEQMENNLLTSLVARRTITRLSTGHPPQDLRAE
jgi:hypothetical protein